MNSNRMTSWRRFIKPVCKIGLFLLVLAAVWSQARRYWATFDTTQIIFSPFWLLLAVPASVAGWLPALGYWRDLLIAQRHAVRFRDAARAYYYAHLGKYVPGKAVALVIRSTQMEGVGAGAAAVTAVYETLVTMGAGVCAAVMVAPWVFRGDAGAWGRWLQQSAVLSWAVCLVAPGLCIVLLGLCSNAFTRFVERLLPKPLAVPHEPVRQSWGRNSRDFCLLVGGWWIHGLSLGLASRAVDAQPIALSVWPVWTAAIAVGTVTGFLAFFVPAGLVVREAALVAVLAPNVGHTQAVLAALSIRVVSLIGEIVAAGLLYLFAKPRPGELAR